MTIKQTLFTVLILAFCAEMGFSLKCHKCSGGPDVCNNNTATSQDCTSGQTLCSKVTVTKDGKESRIYGCATLDDCKASIKVCEEAKKSNPRTTCTSDCCLGDWCNKPPVIDDRLKCYVCQSAKSMDYCVQNSVAETCQNGENRCGKFTTELMLGDKKVMAYRKGCRTEDACKKDKDVFGQACGNKDSSCEFECCGEDLCNAGAFSAVSVMSLFACAVLAFLTM